ncbi:zinc finger protein 888-like [Toxorhynchites rutilus septentrionalis]|uniref:zinc finger protein 888-like n=1 Tax=Toxorhynchites rutilus septentrionalis TaxID=329112 RepID=UPI00247917EA|nr:zinc finger protein 888-like [Toxorhynchites rutilus septentrionalis]XP_055638443.1 zinc finger protein 888-like [Toxorhynchites rutilus septentrionalis]XP_055638444.1 zinc finger protein 888-like [Toxorhynchites rutilus septentrionalis]XP_055638445.1 zinc finger protein 888-like [Toxorhynchites rutilus septentrionalis]XP_055638446.1 zinc finger protein 888-like [Toxorhynchites rutilus septentrionalis]
MDEKNFKVDFMNGERANLIYEQIKTEPIDIKHEPFEFEKEGNDDETTSSYNNENDESSRSEGRSRLKKRSKEVKTIANKCYICDNILENKSDFNDHLKSHTNMLRYKCSQCSTEAKPIEASTVTALNKHFETHGFAYVCTHCPLRYRTWSSFAYHVRNTHDKQKSEYRCQFCERAFNNSQVHRNHENTHKNLIMKRFKCEPCQTFFRSMQHLLQHQTSLVHIKLLQKASTQKQVIKERSAIPSEKNRNDEEMFETEKQRITTNSQENNYNILKLNEISESNSKIPTVKLNPNDVDEKNAENSIQEQIELETVDIKNESSKSDGEEMVDDETIQNYEKTNDETSCSGGISRRQNHPKEVKTIPKYVVCAS